MAKTNLRPLIERVEHEVREKSLDALAHLYGVSPDELRHFLDGQINPDVIRKIALKTEGFSVYHAAQLLYSDNNFFVVKGQPERPVPFVTGNLTLYRLLTNDSAANQNCVLTTDPAYTNPYCPGHTWLAHTAIASVYQNQTDVPGLKALYGMYHKATFVRTYTTDEGFFSSSTGGFNPSYIAEPLNDGIVGYVHPADGSNPAGSQLLYEIGRQGWPFKYYSTLLNDLGHVGTGSGNFHLSRCYVWPVPSVMPLSSSTAEADAGKHAVGSEAS